MSVILEEYRNTRDGMRYGFAVGKVRVLETRLLDRSTLERLVDAHGFGDQRRILSETPYGRFLDTATTAVDVETAIDEALDSAYDFLDEAGLPAAVVSFFRLRFDFANLKATLKARLLGAGLEGLLAAHGSIPVEAYQGPLEKLPAPLGHLAAALEDSVTELDDEALMALDARLDREMFGAMLDAADEAGSAFLQHIARLSIDLANLKTLVRASALEISPSRVERDLLIDGGTIPARELAKTYRMPRGEALAAWEHRYRLPGSPLTATDEPIDLDVVADNALVAAVRRGRRPEPGAEDVIAYVLAREAEAQVLRVALLGKMAGLDSTALHRRMRASFR